jgi:Protein of unknown function (DUF2865)
MAKLASGRVDPRALLRSVRSEDGNRAALLQAGVRRSVAVAMASVVGLGAFGTMVVRANDDAGAIAFIRSQVKPRPAPVAYAPPRAAYPVSYYAPRAFVQPAAAAPQRQGQAARNGAIVASYAPFAGFFPSQGGPASQSAEPLRPRSATVPQRRSADKRAAARNADSGFRGGQITYCVRTCDGFFFPLSASTGSTRGDETACNRLCPTAETKVYVGQVGATIEDARARDNGRRYAAMPNALSYRTSYLPSCSCNAGGLGLTNAASIANDSTLKVGDIVMTQNGMRVFIGGQAPYKDANFTSIDRSRTVAGGSRDTLRSMERASMPGRSGVAGRPARTDEVADLRRAAQSLQVPGQMVRYVGPDRTSVAR